MNKIRVLRPKRGLIFLFWLCSPAFAEPKPFVFRNSNGECVSTSEICGDGIDQDCDGRDRLCPGLDQDNDSFVSEQDCDDTNRFIYAGISEPCRAECGTGTRSCLPNGRFTACSCEILCESSAGKCFYISPSAGSDLNDGSFLRPWKTFANVFSHTSTQKPPRWRDITAGDVVYLLGGVFSDSISDDAGTHILKLKNVRGSINAPVLIKAYPGSLPILTPSSKSASGILFEGCSDIILEGIEVTKAWQYAIRVVGSDRVELRNNIFSAIDGIDNNNVSAINANNARDLFVHHSLIFDSFDRTNSDTNGLKTENSFNVVIFEPLGRTIFRNNVVFNSPPVSSDKTGGCFKIKRANSQALDTSAEVTDNYFRNCAFSAIGISNQNTSIRRNLIIDSDPIHFRDWGGTARFFGNLVESNTVINGRLLDYNPTDQYASIGELKIIKNITVDNSSSYNQERGIIQIRAYGSDDLYQKVISSRTIEEKFNCYWNGIVSPRFAVFADNSSPTTRLGGLFDFEDWRSIVESNGSLVQDPDLNQDLLPRATACKDFGWRSQ